MKRARWGDTGLLGGGYCQNLGWPGWRGLGGVTTLACELAEGGPLVVRYAFMYFKSGARFGALGVNVSG